MAILCLIFSLIESKWILPAHLAHTKFTPIKENGWRDRFNKRFFAFVQGPFRRGVTFATQWRWSVFAVFCGLLMISAALVQANYVRIIPQPKVPTDNPFITIEMNDAVFKPTDD